MTLQIELASKPQRPITVATLARQLHAAGQGGLEIEIPADAQLDPSDSRGASVDGGTLRFALLQDRNTAAAADALAELGDPPFNEQAVWAAAYELWRREIGSTDRASGRFLAAVHPSISVLRLATAQITGRRDVFDALHLVEATLPYLDVVEPSDLVALCIAERPHTANDFASGAFYSSLSRWFGDKLAAAREMVELLLPESRETGGNLLGAAWMAWFAGDQRASAARLLEADRRPDLAAQHPVTCWIAGRMLAEPNLSSDLAHALEARVLLRITEGETDLRRAGLRAACGVLHVRRAFDEAVRRCIAAGEQEAAAYVAHALWSSDAPLLQAGIFFDWLQLCVVLDDEFGDALDGLDFRLSQLLRPDSAQVEPVLSFLEDWVQVHVGSKGSKCDFAARFDACTRAMLSQPALLSYVFTRWMLSDSRASANAAASIALAARTDGQMLIEFDPAVLDAASESDLRYVAKRVLGYLIEVKQMLALALSFLRLRDAKVRVFPLLHWLLYGQLGYDYPGTTSDALKERAEQEVDTEIKELLGGIAAQLEADMATLTALPRLRELQVSPVLRRNFAKARAKEISRSMREAHALSPIAQLATQVHIKAGETSFQHLGKSFSEPMRFGSHSVSFELPRREALDPVGNAHRRLQFRATKRG